MSPKVFDKICSVCGDKACGFHFDVITCESCKSFFRRYALSNKEFTCFLRGECKIDEFNRTFCKKCRLKKCFDCGMKAEFILTEEQKRSRKFVIEKNKLRKLNNQNNKQTINSVTNLTFDSKSKTNSLTHSKSCNHSDKSLMQVDNFTRNNLTTFLDPNLKKGFEESMVAIQRPITDYNNTFNELEGNRLTELLNAIKYMTDPSVIASQQVLDFWGAVSVMQQKFDIDIRKIIKMSKSLSGFRNISEHDQLVQIKFAALEIVLTRNILYFDFQYECWNIITNNKNSNIIKLELFKEKNYYKRITYENHKHLLRNIGQECDPIVIDLLIAILLFNPNHPKLINQSFIKLQQLNYIELLRRYLQVKYQSESESKSRLSKILNSLTDLHILSEKIRLNCLDSDLNGIPLVKEICDRDSLVIHN